MKLHQFFLAALLGTSTLAACTNDEPVQSSVSDGEPNPIRFNLSISSGAQTRVVTDANYKSMFETGDKVGVFAVSDGNNLASEGNYIQNVCLTYENGGTWSVNEDINYPSDGSALLFYAYYPYQDNADPTALDIDVTTAGTLSESDLLLATSSQAQSTGTVLLTFKHALALVNVQVKAGADITFTDDLAVTLKGYQSSCKLNLADGTSSTTGAATDIKLHCFDADSHIYRAFVPAQSIGQYDDLFTFVQTTAGNSFSYIYASAAETAFKAGSVKKYIITLNGDGETEGIEPGGGSIEDLDDTDEPVTDEVNPAQTYEVGDYYPDDENPEGIVFEVSNGGLSGKIVSLYETTVTGTSGDARWGTKGSKEYNGTIDPDNGMEVTSYFLSMAESMTNQNNSGWLGDHRIWKWLYNKKVDGSLQGDWYCPAVNELKSLFAYIHGIKYADIADSWDKTDVMPGFSEIDRDETLKVFSDKLTAKGGNNIANTSKYATTEEDGTDNVFRYYVENGNFVSTSKDDDYTRLRPIKSF